MKKTNVQKLSAAALLCAIVIVGSLFSFPVFGSKCAAHGEHYFCSSARFVVRSRSPVVGSGFNGQKTQSVKGERKCCRKCLKMSGCAGP